MDPNVYFSEGNILTLLDAPTTLTHPPGGGVKVEKAGLCGEGLTPTDAAADWGLKFAAMVILPEQAEEGDDTDVVQISLVLPSDQVGCGPDTD